MKILVVEDTEIDRKLITKILVRIKNIEVITAEDAFEGYAVLKAIDDIDLLVLDHQMPFVKGSVFIQKLRKASRFKNLLILVSTSEGKIEEFVDNGANIGIQKPYTSSDLTFMVEALIKVNDLEK